MKICFLAENSTGYDNIGCEHGLSVYIETKDTEILFDTGASGLFAENAEKMGINLEDADYCVISHGHFDHTGGVPYFLDINGKAPIVMHKDSFRETYDIDCDGNPAGETTGIRWDEKTRKKADERAVYTDKELWLNEDIVVSGTVSREIPYEMTETFYEKSGDELIPDPMDHEQFLAIRDEAGIFVFSGCSHRGVIPCINHAKKLFPGEKTVGLVAGMHLYNASDEVRKRVIDEVCGLGLDVVMPVHCTGLTAIAELKERLGSGCITAVSGDIYEY